MEDSRIIELLFQRSEAALEEAEMKYRAYCFSIAVRMLKNSEDAEECVNDALLALWNSIPPNRPEKLSAYLATLTRREAIRILRKEATQKRGTGQELLPIDEMEELVAGGSNPEAAAEQKELTAALQSFLQTLPDEQLTMFIDRYWYWDTVPEIAARTGCRESRVKMILHRLRKQLKQKLEREGYL